MAFFFFNDTATAEIYTLSLHDALPISWRSVATKATASANGLTPASSVITRASGRPAEVPAGSASSAQPRPNSGSVTTRSEEHTSELQSRQYLVCRLLLEKKNIYHSSSG